MTEDRGPSPLQGPPGRPALAPRVSLRGVRTPTSVGVVAKYLLLSALLLALGLLLLPWRQSARGAGEVINWYPALREQVVEAPVAGRLVDFFVVEGARVETGDPLVEIRDPDPGYVDRLRERLDRLDTQIAAIEDQVSTYEEKLEAEQSAQAREVEQRGQTLVAERQRLDAAIADRSAARSQLARMKKMMVEGLASQRDLELARAKLAETEAEVEALQAAIRRAAASRAGAVAAGKKAVAEVRTQLQSARARLADLRAKRLDVEVELARQGNRLVRAPRAGMVLDLRGAPGSTLVKTGTPLLTLVPEGVTRAVTLAIDGSDLPLVEVDTPVRLVFEGWPAIQFAGWPKLATGTFGGRVAFVEAAATVEGTFEVVVVPDPDDDPWPAAKRLRQGVRAKGFLLLGRVSLGYELWRQLHDFPPLPPEIDEQKQIEAKVPVTPKKPRVPKLTP